LYGSEKVMKRMIVSNYEISLRVLAGNQKLPAFFWFKGR
jgi:hypothetical protein